MHAAHRVPLEPGSPRSIIDEGEAYTVRGKNGVKVRQDVGKGSAQLCDLREGTEVRVLETHTLEDGTERARITALEAGVVSGWCTLRMLRKRERKARTPLGTLGHPLRREREAPEADLTALPPRLTLARMHDVVEEPLRDPCPEHAQVTWTCTFNGRLEAFFETLTSFLRELEPRSMRHVREWVVVADKGASADHRLAIVHRAPWLTVIAKGKSLHRHPLSLNILCEGFVKTRYWCQWEDDWAVAPGSARAPGGDLLQRALDVARCSGCHQVSMNGAFTETWRERSTEYVTSKQRTPMGCAYVVTELAPAHRTPIVARDDLRQLTLEYSNKFGYRDAFGKPGAPWPLFSLQPSLLDTDFMKNHVYPFSEDPRLNPAHAYWMFEMEAALKFVKFGGTKASIDSGYVARPLAVASSSHNWNLDGLG